MFSGIVEEIGWVAENGVRSDGRLTVASTRVVHDLGIGASVAVNGCCLTVVGLADGAFTVDVMPETARRTTLGALARGDPVNLEASLVYGERVGGHLVSGHIDAAGTVVATAPEGNATVVTIAAHPDVLQCIAPQGSVAVDGISLTVVEVAADAFTVALIPHTLAVTSASGWCAGTRVNLEADLVARYVARALTAQSTEPVGGR